MIKYGTLLSLERIHREDGPNHEPLARFFHLPLQESLYTRGWNTRNNALLLALGLDTSLQHSRESLLYMIRQFSPVQSSPEPLIVPIVSCTLAADIALE